MIRWTLETTTGTIRLGPIAVEFETTDADLARSLFRRYGPFLVDDPGDLRLELVPLSARARGGSPYLPSAHLEGDTLVLASSVIEANVDLARGVGTLAVEPDPLAAEYFIENALRQIVQAIAVERGAFLLHAAGVARPDDPDRSGTSGARVFPGRSGAGKSTISALLRATGGHVISDDLVLIDTSSERPRLIATPFFGTLAPEGMGPMERKLEAIDFLEQSAEPEAIAVASVPDRAATLLANVPFTSCFDRSHRQTLMDAIERTVTSVPVRRLRFRPDFSVLPLINWPTHVETEAVLG